MTEDGVPRNTVADSGADGTEDKNAAAAVWSCVPLPPLLPSFAFVPRPRQRYDGIKLGVGDDPCRLVLLYRPLEEDDKRDALSREHRVPTVAVDRFD